MTVAEPEESGSGNLRWTRYTTNVRAVGKADTLEFQSLLEAPGKGNLLDHVTLYPENACQCSNGADDDRDEATDLPYDLGCVNPEDDDEGSDAHPTPTPRPTNTAVATVTATITPNPIPTDTAVATASVPATTTPESTATAESTNTA
jgi:hypothetical protein